MWIFQKQIAVVRFGNKNNFGCFGFYGTVSHVMISYYFKLLSDSPDWVLRKLYRGYFFSLNHCEHNSLYVIFLVFVYLWLSDIMKNYNQLLFIFHLSNINYSYFMYNCPSVMRLVVNLLFAHIFVKNQWHMPKLYVLAADLNCVKYTSKRS
jgi:hypothetical protein